MALPANHKEVQKNWEITITGRIFFILENYKLLSEDETKSLNLTILSLNPLTLKSFSSQF